MVRVLALGDSLFTYQRLAITSNDMRPAGHFVLKPRSNHF
ncbi:hypothetical protein CVCC1112_3509 [Paenarthrobacter nicotinovorans]|nr:hypothetical protein CVCC1112_3509 [Paenarthrobacter nicotinovorans]